MGRPFCKRKGISFIRSPPDWIAGLHYSNRGIAIKEWPDSKDEGIELATIAGGGVVGVLNFLPKRC
tara:strand:+ start:388 stop:585 length:198 start_codon:yes stop_codon:yes gene_type:complete